MLEFNGRVRSVGQPKQGVSQTTGKSWQFVEVLFEYNWRTAQDGTQYSDSIVLQAWNDTINQIAAIPQGALTHVMFTTTTREYNGKPYNDLRIFKAEQVLLTQQPQQMQMMAQPPVYGQMPQMAQPVQAPFPQQQPQPVPGTMPQQGVAPADNGTRPLPF